MKPLGKQSFHDLVKLIDLDALPIRHAFKGYKKDALAKDFRAGLNGALLAFPQAIAYAMLAGLPIAYGIYCSAVAALVGPLFASSRLTILGPTNATAVMMLSIVMAMPADQKSPGLIALLVCIVGVFLVAGAFLKLAALLRFISQSVIVGYISAAALLIIANQAQHVLGVQVHGARTFFDSVKLTIQASGQIQWEAVAVGAFAFGLMYFLKRYLRFLPGVAVTLVATSVLVLILNRWFDTHLALIDPLPFGSWPVTPPTLRFDSFYLLVGPAIALAFLAALENTVMAKTIASRTGQHLNPNQDLLSLGVANLASGFSNGMVASASPTRSALNVDSGATGPVSSLINGALCVSAALLLGPLIGHLPKAAVAAVVIGAALSLIDRVQIRMAFRSTRSDAVTLCVTFVAALIAPLDFAIFLGVATSIALFLNKASSPQLTEYTFNDDGNLCEMEGSVTRQNPSISIIHVEGELFFGAADLFRDEIRRVCVDPNLRAVILRMRNARHLDATSVMALRDLIRSLRETDRHLVVSGASKEVYRILRDTGVLEILGKENFFLGSVQNPNLATRKALLRAQALIGPGKADVRIFYDPTLKKAETKT